MSEKEIEAYLVQQVKKAGGIAYKFVSPGNAGVPDRIVLFPNGNIAFVELKSPNGKLTKLQWVQSQRIKNLGFEYWIVDSKLIVQGFINFMEKKEVMPL